MAVRSNREESGGAATLPAVVPFDLAHLTRQSWELGKSTVQGDRATTLGTWTHQNSAWRLSVHQVTTATVIICLRTPVGRERFYGAMRSEFDAATEHLEASPSWRRVR
ncbi:hypothetical protein DJ71_01270 [Halorubrum sp. E3]|uniref:Uncharacterized protein n=1 Tax=Halorubrum persicum TaxID=1383844 RepID=A0A2G1WIB1_9EURY|nr:hypothetical protein [Halorubrum persicum]OYR95998.1 hypothetical protein DJ71_01270 [Halorubrum sp. E3]PHQ38716.1 hypothetical protein DJ69_10395 [Halorubrum persicum]